MDVKVTGINLKIGKKEITVTPEEAQQLKQELDKVLVSKEYIPYNPYPISIPSVWHPYEVTCSGDTADFPEDITYTTSANGYSYKAN